MNNTTSPTGSKYNLATLPNHNILSWLRVNDILMTQILFHQKNKGLEEKSLKQYFFIVYIGKSILLNTWCTKMLHNLS